MDSFRKERIRHDVINLRKTVQLLERTVDDEDWSASSPNNRISKWLKTQTVLQGVKHCRAILKKLSPEDYDEGLGSQQATSGEQFHESIVSTLNRLELHMKDANQELKPEIKKPEPRLSFLPLPGNSATARPKEVPVNVDDGKAAAIQATLIPVDEDDANSKSKPLNDLIPNTPPAANTSALLPSSWKLNSAPSTSSSSNLKTSTALQDDLAEQLAHMAQQLKANTVNFSTALSNDKAALQEAEEKLGRNSDVLGKERVRLRDHSGKSGGTTWIVMLSVVVVFAGFFMTFFVIRIT